MGPLNRVRCIERRVAVAAVVVKYTVKATFLTLINPDAVAVSGFWCVSTRNDDSDDKRQTGIQPLDKDKANGDSSI